MGKQRTLVIAGLLTATVALAVVVLTGRTNRPSGPRTTETSATSSDPAPQDDIETDEPGGMWVVTHITQTRTLSSGMQTETTIDLTLDARGNMVARDTDDQGSHFHETWELDDDGFAREYRTESNEGTTSTSYQLSKDARGHLTQAEANDGTTTTYRYDDAGHVIQRTLTGSYIDRDENDQPVSRSYKVVTAFNPDGFVASVSSSAVGLALFQGSQEKTYSYAYDTDGHPISAQCTDAANGETETIAFVYDASGNLSQVEVDSEGLRTTTDYSWVLIADPSPAVIAFTPLVEP